MITAENFLRTTRDFVAPDIVHQFGTIIHEPDEKIKLGLKTIIPTLLMGIIKRGSTSGGAKTLINMVNTHHFEEATSPDEKFIRQGSDVINNIFGEKLPIVVEKLRQSTELNSVSINKILSLSAPMVMGTIGRKIKDAQLGTSGLMNFLGSQKSSLIGLVPSGIPGMSIILKSVKKHRDYFNEKQSWAKIAFLILLTFAAILWLTGRNVQQILSF